MPRADVERFARECDAHVKLGERWLGIDPAQHGGKITVYLFADAAQKQSLMGAADTYIAKPWRNEVYVQVAGFPHPVLGHEIIHVLAGKLARGPFRVAGSAGGLLPNPGLIEGIAVAAAPPESDLSPREWAKAMKDLELLPPLSKLFALGFLGVNASAAYTASGAFVEHIKERYGVQAIKEWYGGRDLPEITGASWSDLERAWHAALDALVLPEAARAQAKARFDRPAIFGRRCPHIVDACRQRAEGFRGQGDHEGALAEYRTALGLDPENTALRIAAAKEKIASGREEEAALQELHQISRDEKVPLYMRDRALEELGDSALSEGQTALAVERYREVGGRIVEEDRLRTLDVKIAAATNPEARPAIVALLLGSKGRGPDKLQAAELLGAWAAMAPVEGLPHYLLARQYLNAGDFDLARDRLDRALARRLEIPRVLAEAERLRLIVACGLRDTKTATQSHATYTALPLPSSARREAAKSLIERCTGQP
jgi:tetratricopeptide (TPR) repeat protein